MVFFSHINPIVWIAVAVFTWWLGFHFGFSDAVDDDSDDLE